MFRDSFEGLKYNTLIPRAAVESLNQKLNRHTRGESGLDFAPLGFGTVSDLFREIAQRSYLGLGDRSWKS
jgi:hypothetical protein